MNEAISLLLIDDEPNNLRALRLDLEDENYKLLTAEDGVQGWDLLQKNRDHIKVILLDRMMPNMDGMKFMDKLKLEPELANIPVIMQTAAAEKEQIVEGIQAGVYYYLAKPYDKKMMLSIVASALESSLKYDRLHEKVESFKTRIQFIRDCTFEIKTLEEASYLATFIVSFFSSPSRMVTGLSELLVNAIEHGNLGITYDEKTELNNADKWGEEINRRMSLPENQDKTVVVNYVKTKKEITVTITDCGAGFNWKEYMTFSPDRMLDNHGRGVAIAKISSFDQIEYIGVGNSVKCTILL